MFHCVTVDGYNLYEALIALSFILKKEKRIKHQHKRKKKKNTMLQANQTMRPR